MTNAFGVVVDNASVRRAAVEGVPETVRSVDEIESKLGPLMDRLARDSSLVTCRVGALLLGTDCST
jgi:hypothetical protein